MVTRTGLHEECHANLTELGVKREELPGAGGTSWHEFGPERHPAAPRARARAAVWVTDTVSDSDSLADRLDGLRARIDAAARRAGRDPADVVLMAVSKGHPSAAIREAYAAGQRDFGESYAQELVVKAVELADLTDLRFHFIGGLQRNKARDVARLAASVHAVDRLSLAEELSRRASQADRSIRIYLEVNVSGERSKGGCPPHEVAALAARVAELPSLELRGLMTIPPADPDPEAARPFFAALRELRDGVGKTVPQVVELSMGMTSDFEVAIAEGASVVRIGTALFGPRPERAP
jgi:PLP dependent protein